MARAIKALTLVCTACDTKLEAEQLQKRVAQLLNTPHMQEQFLKATELLDRNFITTKRSRVLNELRQPSPRSFRFFINKN